jgi:hypothetical protein
VSDNDNLRSRFGAWSRHSALVAWIILVVVGALVIGKMWSFSQELNQRSQENRALIRQLRDQTVSVNELRQESVDSCLNYLEARNAVNLFHRNLRTLLLSAKHARLADYRRTHRRSDLKAARSYSRLANSLHTVKRTCAQKR